MAFVPGFSHDVFVSYAHGDDRAWIDRMVQRLKKEMKARLGTEPVFFFDTDDLRKSRDYRTEIPDSLATSATMLLLPSPAYLRSHYCVEDECDAFSNSIAARRERYKRGEEVSAEFRNELFTFRALILPVDGNAHWNLIPGASDFKFCDNSWFLAQESEAFETEFRKLLDSLVDLLKRMRNNATPVFLYPPNPPAELKEAYSALYDELTAQSYRVLPDTFVDVPGQLRGAAMSVFLLGESLLLDTRGNPQLRPLTDLASQQAKPWVVWRSPAAASSRDISQRGYCRFLEQISSDSKTFLSEKFSVSKLKEQVLTTLRPEGQALTPSDGKKRVYVVFDSSAPEDIDNAGQIQFYYQEHYHFEFSSDPREHTKWLSQSEGVILVWGNAGEEWCSHEFEEMQRLAKTATRGLCLFNPRESKATAVQLIREQATDLCVAEQFGPRFDPVHLAPFFARLQ